MGKTLLVFGLGYSAQAIAAALPQGWQVIGTSRDGSHGVPWPGTDMEPLLDQASHILISIAPDGAGDPVLNALGGAISARCGQFDWVGYLSTVGVYGDHNGGWVDEETPLTPSTARGAQRVAAEAAWQALDLPLHIFRLAGIYGPGRGPFAKVRNGTARRIIKNNQVFSRIHVDDIAQVVLASILAPNPGRIYNVCDDLAAPPEDVIGFAAELLGLPIPKSEPFEAAEMSPMARSFYAESKRVRNGRIKNELKVQLRYPNYKAGLTALLAEAKA